MGFRNNTYATVWNVEPKTDTHTKARISISRKNKETGEYDTDFSGFVSFFGSAVAKKAANLKERDRIKLGEVDVTNSFDKEKNQTYTTFKIFSFETMNDLEKNNISDSDEPKQQAQQVDDGEVEDRLPF